MSPRRALIVCCAEPCSEAQAAHAAALEAAEAKLGKQGALAGELVGRVESLNVELKLERVRAPMCLLSSESCQS